jgi:hypothetical protein
MSLSIVKPYVSVTDANGLPYVGASLKVYLAGTTTYASIYSDEALSTPLPNPLSGGTYGSNARGDFPRAYVAAGTYKLRAETGAGVLIFEEDNIDTGLSAGTGALPISRGGTGATTAAAARAALDVPSNSELTDISTQIADLQTALQGIVAAPQGYLTLTSGTAVIPGDVSAATAVYYTPFIGSLCPIYDGVQFNPVTFAELTLTLSSNHLASTIYDCFVAKDSGSPIIGTGPAWNNSAAGSGSRGTGGGTTELERVSGLWVNKNAITLRNGSTLYSIAARQATFVGSLFMDGTNGQITCHRSYGQSRKWGVWNQFSRQRITLKAGDSTATWAYSNATIRQSNAATGNKIIPFCGMAESQIDATFIQNITHAGAVAANPNIGIGLDSTTTISGKKGAMKNGAVTGTDAPGAANLTARYIHSGLLGISNLNMLEASIGAANVTYVGAESDMLMTCQYEG